MIRIGGFDRPITIQDVAEVRDSYGGITETWTDSAYTWGHIVQNWGGERFNEEQRQGTNTIMFMIRWVAGLSAKHRLIYDDRIYNIMAVTEMGRHDVLQVICAASDRPEDVPAAKSELPISMLGLINYSPTGEA